MVRDLEKIVYVKTVEVVRPAENVDGSCRPVYLVTSRHLKSRPDNWKCQVVRDLEKIVYVKTVEVVRPAENVDGS